MILLTLTPGGHFFNPFGFIPAVCPDFRDGGILLPPEQNWDDANFISSSSGGYDLMCQLILMHLRHHFLVSSSKGREGIVTCSL